MDDIKTAYPRNAKIFAEIVRARVHANSFGWSHGDVNAWLREGLPRFGHPDYGWTLVDAINLGDEFLSEASTW